MEENYIVSDIMSRDLIGIDPESTAKSAAELMKKHTVSSLVIKQNDDIIGIITDKDFTNYTSTGMDLNKLSVKKMMSTNLIFVDPNLSLRDASEIIRKHNIRHLLVKSRTAFVGVVSVKDLLSTLYEEIKNQNKLLLRKVDELEKFYKIAVDRELIMVKLKKKISEMEKELGKEIDPATYIVE